MPELPVCRPLDEADLDDDLGAHPVCHPWKSDELRERPLGDLESVEPGAKIEQQSGVESRADLSSEDEVAVLVVADQKRAEPDTFPLRIGKSADDEVLRQLAFHLEPVLRSPV